MLNSRIERIPPEIRILATLHGCATSRTPLAIEILNRIISLLIFLDKIIFQQILINSWASTAWGS